MSATTKRKATIDDLYRVDGKAELIGGRIVHPIPTGRRPNRVAPHIFRSLDDHAEATGRGEAYTDNIAFVVPELTSGRESFSPDASFFLGSLPDNAMKFLQGPPTFAVEVRSEGDYGPAAEAEMAAKRRDYLEAGTEVVWDVDPIVECIHVYRKDTPDQPVTFGRGQEAHAEPAVAGWRVSLDWIFSPHRTEPR
jgi:Uma2 family endonuclease